MLYHDKSVYSWSFTLQQVNFPFTFFGTRTTWTSVSTTDAFKKDRLPRDIDLLNQLCLTDAFERDCQPTFRDIDLSNQLFSTDAFERDCQPTFSRDMDSSNQLYTAAAFKGDRLPTSWNLDFSNQMFNIWCIRKERPTSPLGNRLIEPVGTQTSVYTWRIRRLPPRSYCLRGTNILKRALSIPLFLRWSSRIFLS